jgi:hypothetical protein
VIASIESQLGGKADFDWRAEGLICRLSVPLTQHVDAPVSDQPPASIFDRNGAGLTSRSADA